MTMLHTKVWFGNPCVRAISKLYSSITNITLKVKLGGNIDALSPNLSILEGCSRKIVIYSANGISLIKEVGGNNWDRVSCPFSLTHMSHYPQLHKSRLLKRDIYQYQNI